jgi:hypothetical protein
MKLEWREYNNPLCWFDAKDLENKLSDNWRLPSIDELEEAFKENKNLFNFNYYWSSDEDFDYYYAWSINKQTLEKTSVHKGFYFDILLVRNIKKE